MWNISSALIQGQPQSAGSVARVPAAKIEAVVLDAVRRHIGHDAPVDNTELIKVTPGRLWKSVQSSARRRLAKMKAHVGYDSYPT
jgi:hypothetical protein